MSNIEQSEHVTRARVDDGQDILDQLDQIFKIRQAELDLDDQADRELYNHLDELSDHIRRTLQHVWEEQNQRDEREATREP